MSGIKDENRIEELRRRLYERGAAPEPIKKHKLQDKPDAVPRAWREPPRGRTDIQPRPTATIATPSAQSTAKATTPASSVSPAAAAHTPTIAVTDNPLPAESAPPIMPKKRKKKYRLQLLLIGLAFFVCAVIVSSIFLVFGNHSISAQNISITTTGPFTIGGGEVMPVQVGITNNNPVAIENATLVVQYPSGAKAATPDHHDLTNERLPINTIKAGETVNVPLRAIVYGQENAEQQIHVSIEYHIHGSNATFVKNAAPLTYKISTSPVVLTADALQKVSSGQETTVTLTLTSNAQTPLSNVLVKAEYPSGFNFESADVTPTTGNNEWLIATLTPATTKTIKLKGIVSGNPNDQNVINFSVGVPSQDNSDTLASVLATAQSAFQIENPFLNVKLNVGGTDNGHATVQANQSAGASIDITNALQSSVYDLQVSVDVSGNALGQGIDAQTGFYDSAHHQIVWDGASDPALKTLAPGATAHLTFGATPTVTSTTTNPQLNFVVNVKGRRVSNANVEQTLLGTARASLQVPTTPVMRADVVYNGGAFQNSGPVPPQANTATTYTASFMVQNGVNKLLNPTVTAVLPPYVTWLNKTNGAGTFSYDPVQRTITWQPGDITAAGTAIGSFQLSLTPSQTQINATPVLVQTQHLSATDAFTNTAIDATNPAVTTEMSTESGYPSGNGRVVQ